MQGEYIYVLICGPQTKQINLKRRNGFQMKMLGLMERYPTVFGLLSMFGAFLLQLVVGAFPGTFGNMLPYFTSYKRQVLITISFSMMV